MAENRVLQWVLRAKDEASAVLSGAEKNITGFAGKAGTALKAIGTIAAGLALGKFFKDALTEAAEAEKGMARLGQAVGNAGGDFGKLRPALEQVVDGVRRLSTFSDDDLREALTRVITLTGDTAGSMKNLGLVADLAAARQIDLSTASDLVAKAMNGNTTGLNRLGFAGKDATTVLENLRGKVGGFAALEAKTFGGALKNLSHGWDEFKEAVGTAILGTGEAGATVGKLAGVMADLEKFVVENAEAIGQFADAMIWLVSGALQLAVTAVQGWMLLLQSGKLLVGDFVAGLGVLGETAGALLSKVGIDLSTKTATAMRKWGEGLSRSAKEGMARLLSVTTEGEQKTTATVEGHGKRRGQLTEDELKRREDAQKSYAKEVARVQEEIAVKSMMVQQGTTEAEAREYVRRQGQLGHHLKVTVSSLESGYTRLDALNEKLKIGWTRHLQSVVDGFAKIPPKIKETTDTMGLRVPPATNVLSRLGVDADLAAQKTGDLGDAIADAARGAIGMVQGLGGIGDAAAGAANNVVTLGDSLAKILKGGLSTGGLVGAITAAAGALTGVLGKLFGGESAEEKARKQLVAENNRALAKLTDATLMQVKVSGGKAQAVQDVLAASVFQPYGRQADRAFATAKLKAGITDKDIEGIAEQLGLQVRNKETGKLEFNALRQVLAALQNLGVGYGASFSEQLSRIREGRSIGAIAESDEFGQVLAAIAGGGNNAILSALQGANFGSMAGRESAAGSLRSLFNQMGSLAKGDLGGLTNAEFVDAISRLVGMLTNADLAIRVPDALVPQLDKPPLNFSASFAEFADVGLQQVDYLASIDQNIGALIDRWTDIDTGLPRQVTITVGDVVVQGGLSTGVTPIEVQEAVTRATTEAMNQALGDRYLVDAMMGTTPRAL